MDIDLFLDIRRKCEDFFDGPTINISIDITFFVACREKGKYEYTYSFLLQ